MTKERIEALRDWAMPSNRSELGEICSMALRTDELEQERDQWKRELELLRTACREDRDRAELGDQYAQWLTDLGRISGCGHLDERLPRCIEEEFEKLREELSRLRSCVVLTPEQAGQVRLTLAMAADGLGCGCGLSGLCTSCDIANDKITKALTLLSTTPQPPGKEQG